MFRYLYLFSQQSHVSRTPPIYLPLWTFRYPD
jgi:hypothetical protein